MKKIISVLLAAVMLLSVAPLSGIVGVDLFGMTASAASYNNLYYEIEDGEVTITGYNSKASGDVIIPSTIEGCPVTTIGAYAFAYFTNLTSITIPNSVMSIDNYSFQDCENITSISIPNSVVCIGYAAFRNCTRLTTIYLGNGVTNIGGSSFYGTGYYNNDSNWVNNALYIGDYLIDANTAIAGSYTIKEGTKLIAGDVFKSCTNLTSITIPDSVKSIGRGAFEYCERLASITIPDSVTSIGDYAFFCCENLTSITIPDGVTNIGEYTFYRCENLRSVAIGNSVKSIGANAFYRCVNVKSISIPDGVTSIADHAFSECYCLKRITLPNSMLSIGESAFSYCRDLTSIAIPGSVTSIGDEAFASCQSLTNFIIPDSVTSIEDNTFEYCTSLTNITIPDSVISIGNYAFSNCTKLVSITIPDSVTSIGIYAFTGCRELSSITIPNSVTNLGDCVFRGCYNLANITIPDYITSIGVSLFSDCYRLTDITIPNGVTNIGSLAFENCTNLTCITIPYSVTNIGESAFENCTKLSKITISDSVESISSYAFNECASLKDVYYPGSEEQWNNIKIGSDNNYLLNATIHYNYVPCVHSNTVSVEVAQATCTKDGSTNICCSECDEILNTVVVPALGHEFGDWIITTVSTCTKKGYKTCFCLRCKTSQTIPIELINHEIEAVPAKAPTCTEDGNTEGVRCKNCGETLSGLEIIPKLGHDWVKGEKVEVTCTTDGYTPYTCSRCHLTENKDIVKAVGKHYYERIVVMEATCTEEGLLKCVCMTCGDTYTESIPRKNHSYELTDVVPSTCVDVGSKTYTCTMCGESYSYTIPTINHSYELTDVVPSTCVDVGSETYTCTMCGESYSYTIPTIEHSYVATTVAPTCTTVGYINYKCSVCSSSFNTITEPPTGHKMDEWVVLQKGSCTMFELRGRTCLICDYKEMDYKEAPGHDYNKTTIYPTCTEDGYIAHVCSVCGDSYNDSEKPALGHDFGRWVVLQNGSCTEDEIRERTCSRCNVKEINSKEATGHKLVTDQAVAPTCTEDGLSKGEHCATCNEIFVEQTVISATGHHDSNNDGYCDNCNFETDKVLHCSCRCHKTDFFSKIIWFFEKLFGAKNRPCECGASHR